MVLHILTSQLSLAGMVGDCHTQMSTPAQQQNDICTHSPDRQPAQSLVPGANQQAMMEQG